MFKDNIFIEESEKLINSSELNTKKTEVGSLSITEIEVDAKQSKEIGRNKGKYITIAFNKDTLCDEIENLIETLITSIKSILTYLKLKEKVKVLFVGLGNKDITSDKFGNLCIEKIAVSTKTHKVYKDVEGLTNIKSIDFTRAISELVGAELVIVFDSLKAEHIERLGSTIQISTGGLYPGSAVSDKKQELSKKTIKTNVISIGIPTIINMKSIENNNPNLLVSTKDIDRIVDDLSSILSIAINRMF